MEMAQLCENQRHFLIQVQRIIQAAVWVYKAVKEIYDLEIFTHSTVYFKAMHSQFGCFCNGRLS